MVLAFLSSCSTSKKTETANIPVPVPPAEVTFTKVINFKTFASIQLPIEGKGFTKDKSSNYKNDSGETVPSIRFKGSQVYAYNDLSEKIDIEGDKSDINNALETFKKRGFLRHWLRKDNVIEEYTDVVIGGKTCKRISVSYNYDESYDFYTLGYIIPYNETTALFFIDQATTSPTMLEEDVKVLDSVLKYMVETVEFKENN